MRALALVLLLACSPAWAEPAPRPPGWPSDICLAEGVNSINPLCGTCSTSVWYPMPGVGTSIQWQCKGADGKWMVHGLIRPWMTPPIRPSMTDVILKGPFAAWWDANAVRTSPEDEAKYAKLLDDAKLWGSTAVRPKEPPPPAPVTMIVAPVSTGQRPSYLLVDGRLVREVGAFVPTVTAGQPTACDCDAEAVFVVSATARRCAVRGITSPSGAQRFADCQPSKP